MKSCALGYEEITNLLLDNGARPFLKDKYGRNCQKYAEIFDRYNILDILEKRDLYKN